ncbi:hypothetical protein QZH41_011019, partial [Actinostola sp. cb2023]
AYKMLMFSRGENLSVFPSQKPLFPHNSRVHEITDGSLDALSKFTDRSSLKFVLYYAPWCGQSRKAIPEFMRVANVFHQEVTFIAINCWLGSCHKEYQLEYFPQIVAYHSIFSGVQYPETNDVLALYMIRFIQNIMRPFSYVGREEELQEVKATNQEVVLSYIDNVDNKEYRRFFGVALEYVGKVSRPFFGLVINENIASKLGLSMNGQISFYRALDSTSVYHPKANNSIRNITHWISQNRKEIIIELVPKPSNRDFLNSQLNEKAAVILFLPVRRHKISMPLLRTVSIQYLLNLETRFITQSKCRRCNDLHTFVVVEFVMAFMNSRLERALRSADTPSYTCPETQACVVEVTLATLDRIVMDKDKDVLLVYYAPWCGFCVNLAPVLLTVARFFKDFKNVIIARIDADQNDLPWQHTVTSYPTIILYPARRKDFSVRFPDKSERTSEALIKFILQHGTEAAYHALYEQTDDCDSDVIKNKFNQLVSSLRRAEQEKQVLETRLDGIVMEKSLLELKRLKLMKGTHEAQRMASAEKDARVSMETKVKQAEESQRQTDYKNFILALRNAQLELELSQLKGELQVTRDKSRQSLTEIQRLTTLREEMEDMNELVVKKLGAAESIVSHLQTRDRLLSSKIRRLQSTRNTLRTRLTRTSIENTRNKKLIVELNAEKRMLDSLLRDAGITVKGLKASLVSSEKRLGDEEQRHDTAAKKHREANEKLQEMKINYEKLTVILSQIDIPKKQQHR